MTRALAAGRIGHSFDDATDPDLLREVERCKVWRKTMT